jgi:hypothetical protein
MSNFRRHLIMANSNDYELVHFWDKNSVQSSALVDNVRNASSITPVDFSISGSVTNDGTYINVPSSAYMYSESIGTQYLNKEFYVEVSALANDTTYTSDDLEILIDLGSVKASNCGLGLMLHNTSYGNNAKFYSDDAGTKAGIPKNAALGWIDLHCKVGIEKKDDGYGYSFLEVNGVKAYGKAFTLKKVGTDIGIQYPWTINAGANLNTRYYKQTDMKIRYIKIFRKKL